MRTVEPRKSKTPAWKPTAGGRYKVKSNVKGAQLKLAATTSKLAASRWRPGKLGRSKQRPLPSICGRGFV